MPIPLTQPQTPSAKLPTIGSGIEVAIIGTRRRPWTEFGTGQPKLGQDGKPREQLVVTGVVVSHQNAVVGEGTGVDRPAQVGEVLTVWLHSHNWFRYIEANRAHGVVNVGDVMLWHYTHDEPSQQAGANMKKVRNVTLRRPRPEEAPIVAQAERLYYELGFDKPESPSPQSQTPAAPYAPSTPPADGSYGAPPQPQQQQMPYGQPQPQPSYPSQPQPQPQGYPQGPSPYSPTQNLDPSAPNFDPGF